MPENVILIFPKIANILHENSEKACSTRKVGWGHTLVVKCTGGYSSWRKPKNILPKGEGQPTWAHSSLQMVIMFKFEKEQWKRIEL